MTHSRSRTSTRRPIATGESYYEVVVGGKPVRCQTLKSAVAYRAMYQGVLRHVVVFTDREEVTGLKADGTEDSWAVPTFRY